MKELSNRNKMALACLVLAVLALVIFVVNPHIGRYLGGSQADSLDSGRQLRTDSGQRGSSDGGRAVRYFKNVTGDAHDLSNANLTATVAGQTYTLINPDTTAQPICFDTLTTRDFDGDGFTDILVVDIEGCGGNCCPNSFFFFSYNGAGLFMKSESFGQAWGDPVVEKWKGKWSVVTVAEEEGTGRHAFSQRRERYILAGGKAVLVEQNEKKAIPAIDEIRSEEVSNRSDKRMYYDLDEDGEKDVIVARYWERWNRLLFDIEFANGNAFHSPAGFSRIGVLGSTTNGVHDLVGDFDTIIRWNGKTYEADEAPQK